MASQDPDFIDLRQSSILSIIQSKFKKFLGRYIHHLLLILLLFIVYNSINDLAAVPAYENQSILNLDFESGGNQSILNLDFERQNFSISPMASSHFRSIIYNNESSSLGRASPIFGNNSLRVDIKPSNDTTKWNAISTDLIPVNEDAQYDLSLYLSANDANQLHSKINYYDSNKKEIESDLISGGRSGTFEVPYKTIISSPNGTKYMQLQILAKGNPNMSSSYIIDNVKIENVPLGQVSFTNNNKDFLLTSTETDIPIFGNNSLRVDVKPGNKVGWNTISTNLIPANENAYYNASLEVSAKDVNQLHSKIAYYDSNKTEIKSAFIFGGRNGTFEAPYNITDSSPNGTKYMQLQIWVRSNPVKSSSFLIDKIIIKDISNYDVAKNDLNNLNRIPADQNLTIANKEDVLKVEIKKVTPQIMI